MNLDKVRAVIATDNPVAIQQVALSLLLELERATPRRVAELEASMADMEASLELVGGKYREQEAELGHLQTVIDGLQPSLGAAAAENASLKAKLAEAVSERDAMRQALDPHRLEAAKVTEENRLLRAQLEEMRTAHTELQGRHHQLWFDHGQLQQELSGLK